MIYDFENLEIWRKARELNKSIYSITRRDGFCYDTRFVQQIRAAAGSIMDNIAEWYERNGNKEFINFLFIAKGSCGETRSQLVRAFDAGYISPEEYNKLYADCRQLSASLMKFIKELQTSDFKGSKYSNP